jgi:Na+-driven multidrug efflux pump
MAMIDRLRTPQGRDALLTTLTEGMAMLGMIYAYHLAARTGTEDLDLYVITRRTVSFIYPVILMGSAVGLTRFVAMSRDPGRQRAYLRGAMTYVMPIGLFFLLCSALLQGPLGLVRLRQQRPRRAADAPWADDLRREPARRGL